MSTTQNEKCKDKHFIWSKPMSHMLLEILVEEALKGNKPSSTFRAESFVKMITVSKDVYDEEVKAMKIVVGKDMATKNYAESYADVNLEENIEEQSISIENEGEYEETSKGKGTSSSNDSVEKLSKNIGDVAFAIQSLSKNQLDVNKLYTEVMKIEGFDEITLGDAFDHLVQHEMLAKAFMVKNANLRKIWVQNFMNQRNYRPDC
ncbi:hypothetical protein Peur_073247 [Populus x canadensis]